MQEARTCNLTLANFSLHHLMIIFSATSEITFKRPTEEFPERSLQVWGQLQVFACGAWRVVALAGSSRSLSGFAMLRLGPVSPREILRRRLWAKVSRMMCVAQKARESSSGADWLQLCFNKCLQLESLDAAICRTCLLPSVGHVFFVAFALYDFSG